MSISIGRNRVYSQVEQPFLIYTQSSNAIQLKSDNSNVYIQFDRYRLGQAFTSNPASFQLNYQNTLLGEFTPTKTTFVNPTIFQNGIQVNTAFSIQNDVISTSFLKTSNLEINAYSGLPIRITSNQELLLRVDPQQRLFYKGNVGIGLTEPSYALEVSQSARIHSNLLSGSMATQTIYYKTIGHPSRIEFTSNLINLSADTVQLNNPYFTGNIVFQDISILNGDIDKVFASNVYVYNQYLDRPGIYIQQNNSVDPPYFSDTLLGNPISIDSYFYNINNTIRIFQVDSYGRISSGKITILNQPDYGIQYYVQSARMNYHKGFLNFETYRPYEQTTVNARGYISIGSNLAKHPLHITQPYTGYEFNYSPVSSLIGLYQTTSNQTAFLKCFNCNQEVVFTLSSNGGLIFGNDKQFGQDYTLENSKKSFLANLHLRKVFSDQYVDFQQSTLSNIQKLYASNMDIAYGVMSNIQIYNLSVNSIQTNSFECIDDMNNYEEFRIHSTRFLFYGSNLVMNPNRYFFQVEQPNLPDDNLRIYANGGPTRNVNVIHTIANNQTSSLRMNNCNIAVNSITKVELEANENRYNFGVINKSTIPGGLSEAFITNNANLITDNRQLNITSTGCRVGGTSGIHLLQTGRVTINDTVDANTNLRVKGNLNVYTDTIPSLPSLFTDKTTQNVGISTSFAAANLHVNGTVYVNSNNITSFQVSSTGNVGIGTSLPQDRLDVTVSSTFRHLVQCTSNVTIQGRLDTLGNVASTSDERLKEQLTPIVNPLNKLEKLTGYTYYRKDLQHYETGLLAQEVLSVLPEAVHVQPDGYYTLAYGNLAGLLVESIKALKKENDLLKACLMFHGLYDPTTQT